MSAGGHIIVPHVSWEGVVSTLAALGLGGILTEWIRRPSRRTVAASAAKDEATGEAAVIASMATAFTGTTASLREEIDRLQDILNDLRARVVEAEAELRAASLRETDLARENVSLRSQLDVSHADVLRLRAERDGEREKGVQQEGEIRQLKAVIDAHSRVAT